MFLWPASSTQWTGSQSRGVEMVTVAGTSSSILTRFFRLLLKVQPNSSPASNTRSLSPGCVKETESSRPPTIFCRYSRSWGRPSSSGKMTGYHPVIPYWEKEKTFNPCLQRENTHPLYNSNSPITPAQCWIENIPTWVGSQSFSQYWEAMRSDRKDKAGIGRSEFFLWLRPQTNGSVCINH